MAPGRNVCVAMGRSEHEHGVWLELHAEDSVSSEQLEETTLDILHAIETKASHIALGAVATADLDEETISVVFTICAAPAEIFDKLHQVVAAIAGGGEFSLQRANVEDRTLVSA